VDEEGVEEEVDEVGWRRRRRRRRMGVKRH
jgi:hypothetical protein